MFRDQRRGQSRPVHALAAVLGLLLLIVTAGCTGGTGGSAEPSGDDEAPDPRNGGRLVVAVGSAVGDLDPAGPSWSEAELQVARAVYDRLAVYDDNYALQPELARSITPNEDFTEWVIELRRGVFFHDGTPLDADAVLRNIESQRSSPSADLLFAPVKSVFVTGPRTVHVRMRSPWSTFAHALTGQPGYVAAPATIGPEAPPGLPVGTGPFVARQQGEGVFLAVKNSAYWQQGQPRLDEVDFRVIEDGTARTDALLRGRVDMVMADDPVEILRLQEAGDRGRASVIADPETEDPKLTAVFNVARMPFLDPIARHAVASATSRTALEPIRFDGLIAPSRTPFIQQSLWYNDVGLVAFDAARARRDQVKWQEIYGVPMSFTLGVPAEPTPVRFAAAWQRQLAAVGITVQVVPQHLDEVRAAASVGEFQAVLLPMWGAWHPDRYYPIFHQVHMTSVGAPGPNFSRFGTPAINEALDLARETDDLATQVDQYRKLQDEIAAGGAYLVLGRLPRVVAVHPDIRDTGAWTTAEGADGLAMEGGAIALTSTWMDRPDRPSE
jgi:peptide/nickel transport system substrate-binding protein